MAYNLRAMATRMADFMAFTANWLLFVVDNTVPFIGDLEGVGDRWFWRPMMLTLVE